MDNPRNNQSSQDSAAHPPKTLEGIMWDAVDSGEMSRKSFAAAFEISEDVVSRLLNGHMPKLQSFRCLLGSSLVPMAIRDACVAWFLRPTPYTASRTSRTAAEDLDVNHDHRIDGRDAVALQSAALSHGAKALEELCRSLRDGRLTVAQRDSARRHLAELDENLRRVREVLDHEEGGGSYVLPRRA